MKTYHWPWPAAIKDKGLVFCVAVVIYRNRYCLKANKKPNDCQIKADCLQLVFQQTCFLICSLWRRETSLCKLDYSRVQTNNDSKKLLSVWRFKDRLCYLFIIFSPDYMICNFNNYKNKLLWIWIFNESYKSQTLQGPLNDASPNRSYAGQPP